MPQFNNPEITEIEGLDPELQSQYDKQQELAESAALQDEQAAVQAEAEAEVETKDEQFEKWSHKIPVYGALKYASDSAALGVADFATDAIGLVPWLKPVDQWWDDNSPRHNHPAHKLIRDASSIIIPSVVGGSWVVGGAKAAVAAKAITLPTFIHTAGSIAAYTGVDTSVAMISSHSKTDDNLAGTLNNWLGWNIPWATRPGDDPDVRWKKNVYEAAGLAAGVELLGAAFTFGRKAKLFPRDQGAEQAIQLRKFNQYKYEDPLSEAVGPTREARKAEVEIETIDAIKNSDNSEYNSFINDVGEDSAGKAVVNIEPDPLQAKLHQAQIQTNTGSLHGRAAPVASESFQKEFMRAIDGNARARQLDQLFDSISPNFDAVVVSGGKQVRITAEQMNQSVDNLTQAIYGKDLSLKEFEFIVDDMKTKVFNSNEILDEESWVIASQAFKKAFDTLFDPNQMRASGMLAQNAADTVTDTASAARILGDEVDTSRQMGVIFDKLNLLGQEVRANEFIISKAQEYKTLLQTGDVTQVVDWMNRQADNFDSYLTKVKRDSSQISLELQRIAKENPNYYRAFKEAYDATDGDVNTLHKLHRLTESKIGLIKKGFLDGEPEVPSIVIKGLHGARINSLLAGLAPARAALGNSMLTFAKPISIFAGAAVRGDAATLKRAQYVFGGISENIKRGFKVMRSEWDLAVKHPEDAMARGRVDMQMQKLEHMEYMDSMAKGWEADEEWGKVAMWKLAKGLTWWNKQPFVRFGTNALYAIDGFTNSFMASGMSRARAYDELFDATRGGVDDFKFQELQRNLYNQAFDDTGLLTDTAAKHAAQEIALNLDSKVVRHFENMLDHIPAARSIFLFPRTGVNAFELGWSFSPTSNLGPALTKARRVLGAKTEQAKIASLLEHGIDASQDADLAFKTLKSEYIGRQIMGSTVVMGASLWALEGNLTGNGPQDAAEKARMMALGWKPLSIRNPITGDWHSYRGFEPFSQLLGLTADVVYQANRVDQAITEDLLRKAGYAISMNLTNGTFISGFEPLVGLLSSDPSAWNRFFARQANMMIPYAGVRSILNKAVTPQLKDVENDFFAQLANMNKFLYQGNEYLKDQLDIYTGNPINYFDTFTAGFNSVLPSFNTNGGLEPWRQWLLSTGWDGLQKIRKNRITGEPLSTVDRHWINNWIAQNSNLRIQIENMMTEGDGFWNKKLTEYRKDRGQKHQKDFPIKEHIMHRELDRIHDRAFNDAWNALQIYKSQYSNLGRESKWRNLELRRGNTKGAARTQKRVKQLQQEVRR